MFVVKAAVVGAGTMGGQIAQAIAAAGYDVVLKDVSQELLDAGIATARDVTATRLRRSVEQGKLTQEQADADGGELVARITPTLTYDGFGDVDFVIEAVPERLEIKQAVFAELDAVTPGHAILASNTSGLSITEIGDATVRPDKVVGFHFFYPASVMPLIEVVRGDETSRDTVAAAFRFAQALRKQPIVCADAPGFVVNRILVSGIAEIWRAQERRRLSIAAVDEAIAAAGISPMPPYLLVDLLGLDTVMHLADHLEASYGDRMYVHRGMVELVAAGRLGAKTGGGFFADGEASLPEGDGDVDGAELAELMTLKTLVEACLVLEEGISTMREIDLGLMAGAGLDPRRGLLPPFLKADVTGLDVVLERLEALEAIHGERFAPPTTLRRLVAQGRLGVASGQGFYAYARPDAGEQADTVKLETRGDVAIAWLSNGQLNSISPAVIGDLATVRERAATAGVRALVIASSSPLAFSAGADIKAFSQLDEAALAALVEDAHALFDGLGGGGPVTIAAVNALAFGGGNELVMACDVRIAAKSAVFAQPEIKLGIIPGWGGTQRLPRLVGAGRALELNLLGDALLADDAHAFGLVNRVVPDHELLDTALAWARRLAAQAPLAVDAIRQLGSDDELVAGLAAERTRFAEITRTGDAGEGISAFLGKRAARWAGD
ncbi:MAG TPA: 3-hydroxyacyl-CoA dehydrogenase NAD-binding domain-containing protein [Solirubrobacteraceae bacterium]|nr:3-hydroxyacyl-CoA dehydrogenase NAD-binding domain-containing protein [Solirubrobacteraceae bacterium]